MQYVTFYNWLLSRSVMPLTLTDVAEHINTSFLYTAEQYSIVWMYYS